MKKSNVEKKLNVIEEHVKCHEVQNKKELIKTGNVYNMDCYEGLCRIETGKITAFVSDVPYEMSVAGKKRTGTAKKADYLNNIEFMCDGFDMRILDECCRIMPKIKMALYCSKKQLPKFVEYFSDKDVEMQLFTWSKSNCVPYLCNNTYLNCTEYIFVVYDKSLADEIHFKTDHYITPRVSIKKTDEMYHPSTKIADQVADLIVALTNEDDVVGEPFAGSGITLEAAIKTNRKFVGFEIEKNYFNICQKRIELALMECPDYCFEPENLENSVDVLHQDITELLNSVETGDISMAYFDVCDKYQNIPFGLIENVIAKQHKPNFYIMSNMAQFPLVLNYFSKKGYKYDIIANHLETTTKYLFFFRRGGVKLYGDYTTKKKYYEDNRDMTLPYQDSISHELMRRIVINSSLPKDNIFVYGGYGTTIETVYRENRHYIAYEPDEGRYSCCKDVIERLKTPAPSPDPLGGAA